LPVSTNLEGVSSVIHGAGRFCTSEASRFGSLPSFVVGPSAAVGHRSAGVNSLLPLILRFPNNVADSPGCGKWRRRVATMSFAVRRRGLLRPLYAKETVPWEHSPSAVIKIIHGNGRRRICRSFATCRSAEDAARRANLPRRWRSGIIRMVADMFLMLSQ
jgi:hypothetical protein